MKKLLLLAFFTLTFSSVFFGQENKVKTIDSKIRRIKPSEFTPSEKCPKMPLNIVEYLEKMNCTIPQSSMQRNNGNAFQIQFNIRGQNDWAVLCSLNGYSSILVFWGGQTQNVSEFAKYPDKDFVGAGGYFRRIGKDTEKTITEYNVKTYGDIISEIDTWGIDEETSDRKHIIYYIYKKQLVVLEWGT